MLVQKRDYLAASSAVTRRANLRSWARRLSRSRPPCTEGQSGRRRPFRSSRRPAAVLRNQAQKISTAMDARRSSVAATMAQVDREEQIASENEMRARAAKERVQKEQSFPAFSVGADGLGGRSMLMQR